MDSIYEVVKKEIIAKIEESEFVSIQADETTDIIRISQFVIVLRFIVGFKPIEVFWKFINLKDRTAVGMRDVIFTEIGDFIKPTQLIAQTYDGAASMSGVNGGVQILMKEMFPCAHFVHCYAHQINLILKRACSSNKKVRIFFANCTGFTSFFANSPKRSDLFADVCLKRGLPRAVETRRNFQSRLLKSTKILDNKEH